MVFAGEVFSEEWRDLVAARGGIDDPASSTASLYGTADAGVLANETPLSVPIRRFLAGGPTWPGSSSATRGCPRSSSTIRPAGYFEVHEGTLLFSGDNGVPLVRYHIADEGGLVSHDDMVRSAAAARTTVEPEADGPELPFVFVFGRSLFTVSFFGANVYPENVTVGLEQPGISDWVTGKFVLETYEDEDRDRRLRVTVELARGRLGSDGDADRLAEAIHAQLVRLNSEFAHYVPPERQRPEVVLRPAGDPEYFPIGVKHRYTRGPLTAN